MSCTRFSPEKSLNFKKSWTSLASNFSMTSFVSFPRYFVLINNLAYDSEENKEINKYLVCERLILHFIQLIVKFPNTFPSDN